MRLGLLPRDATNDESFGIKRKKILKRQRSMPRRLARGRHRLAVVK